MVLSAPSDSSVAPVIVVAGSLHYDIMVDAPSLPRKGETVIGRSWRPKFGGKGGNQAIAAAKAGATVRMVGAVGDDAFGRFLLDELTAHDIDTSSVARCAGIGSGMSVAISDSDGDYGAVIVSGANLLADPAGLVGLAFAGEVQALVMQNEMPEAINLAAARAAREAGLRVCLNAAPYRPISGELAALVDLLVVNAIEAEDFTGIAVTDLISAEAAAKVLAGRIASVVVTAGGSGAAGITVGEPPVLLPVRPVRVVSTHGAGDVFMGTLVVALSTGHSFETSMRAANEAAGIHVSQRPSHDHME
ncbi:PfkB family carbohydrate kinase [Mesorhizobium sp. 10J20-29]